MSELLRARPRPTAAACASRCSTRAATRRGRAADDERGPAGKYLDFVDCTGGGDVAMSAANRTDDGGGVAGLSGRRLELGPWADGVERFPARRVRLWDVAPASVQQQRVKRERRAAFEARQHLAATRVQHRLDAHARAGRRRQRDGQGREARPRAAAQAAQGDDVIVRPGCSGASSRPSARSEAEARALPSQGTTTRGRCSTCCSSKTRRACRASSSTRDGTGDLRARAPMAPYKVEAQVGEFGFGTALSFCVQARSAGEGGGAESAARSGGDDMRGGGTLERARARSAAARARGTGVRRRGPRVDRDGRGLARHARRRHRRRALRPQPRAQRRRARRADPRVQDRRRAAAVGRDGHGARARARRGQGVALRPAARCRG